MQAHLHGFSIEDDMEGQAPSEGRISGGPIRKHPGSLDTRAWQLPLSIPTPNLGSLVILLDQPPIVSE